MIESRIARFGLPCPNGSDAILAEPDNGDGKRRMFYRLCRAHADDLFPPLRTLWGGVDVTAEDEPRTPCDVPVVIALVADVDQNP